MPCPCNKTRRPLLGRPAAKKPAASTSKAKTSSVTASAAGSWGTTCSDETYSSLLRARTAASACGGQVKPA